jgi:hypothetical protein
VNTPLIDNLDMREEWVRRFEQAHLAYIEREALLGAEWNWPELPSFLKRKKIQVVITADATKLNEALRRIQTAMEDATITQLILHDYFRRTSWQSHFLRFVQSKPGLGDYAAALMIFGAAFLIVSLAWR